MKNIILIVLAFFISFSEVYANEYSQVSEHKYELSIGKWKVTKILSVFGDIEELNAMQAVDNGYGYNFTMILAVKKTSNLGIEYTYLNTSFLSDNIVSSRDIKSIFANSFEYAIDDGEKSKFETKKLGVWEKNKEFLSLLYNNKKLSIRFDAYNQGIFHLEGLEEVVQVMEKDFDKLERSKP